MLSRLSRGDFVINNPQKSKVLNKIFVAAPTILQEKKIGIIFYLAEIPATDDFNQTIINLIDNEAKHNFYTLENLEEGKPLEDLFEDFLYRLNKKIHRLIQEEKTLFDLEKINVIIGIIQPDYSDKKISFNIHFSQTGKIEMILIQKIGYKNYKLTQVNKSADSGTAKPNPFKFFSNIISGKLANEDYLVLSNCAILDYISLDKLKSAATTLPADKLVEHFKSLLIEVDEKISFGFIVFNLRVEKDYFEETRTIAIETMPKIDSGKMTLPEIKKIPELIQKEKPKKNLLAKLFRGKKMVVVQEKIADIPEQIDKSQTKYSFWQKLKLLVKKSFKPIKKTKTILEMEKSKRDNLVERWSQQKLKKIDTQITGIKKISLLSKTLLIFGVIFAILFIISLSFLNQKQKKGRNENLFNQLAAQIEEKKNLAESSLIYNDETKAKQSVKEAFVLLEQLPQNNDEQQKEFEKLSAEIKAMDQKLKRLVNILESSPFMDFAKELNGASINKIIKYSDNLFAWQAQDNKIYQIDLTTKKISLINYTPLNIGEFKNAAAYDASAKAILLLHQDNKLTKLNLADKTLTPQEIKLPGNAEIADFEIYNNKLYLVDSKNNQIYKYQIIEAGFANQKNWLAEKNVDLSGAVSMAIDSNLYLLERNGQILKFYTGKKQNFAIKNLEPILTNPIKIHTSLDDQYIYILEPAGKRLIIADKDGKLIIQYYSEKFSNLKDFAVLEKAKKIYLLNDQQLYQITIDFIK